MKKLIIPMIIMMFGIGLIAGSVTPDPCPPKKVEKAPVVKKHRWRVTIDYSSDGGLTWEERGINIFPWEELHMKAGATEAELEGKPPARINGKGAK